MGAQRVTLGVTSDVTSRRNVPLLSGRRIFGRPTCVDIKEARPQTWARYLKILKEYVYAIDSHNFAMAQNRKYRSAGRNSGVRIFWIKQNVAFDGKTSVKFPTRCGRLSRSASAQKPCQPVKEIRCVGSDVTRISLPVCVDIACYLFDSMFNEFPERFTTFSRHLHHFAPFCTVSFLNCEGD